METTIKGGYVVAELSLADCELLAHICRIARRSPGEPGLVIPRGQIETLGSLFTLGVVALSAHINMCHQDMLDHLDHLNQLALGLPQIVHP